MTGYGKAEALLSAGRLRVEIRSLNGKSADITLKSPLIPKEQEIPIRKMVAERLVRGSIDIFLGWEADSTVETGTLNRERALVYYSQFMELADEMDGHIPFLKPETTALLISALVRLPGVVEVQRQQSIPEDEWPLVELAFAEALEALDAFRVREGEVLRRDVTDRVQQILSLSHEIEQHEPLRAEAARQRILARFEELAIHPDPARLEQEMIYYIEKFDINEERVRLRQHCAYFLETLEKEPCPGRKLGFIAQEMGREINTTGSKANHPGIQLLVTGMKDALEKIKEQSLNIL